MNNEAQHHHETAHTQEGDHEGLITRREVLIGAAALAACGDEDGGATGASHEAKAPLPPWNATLENGYWRTLPDGTTARYTTRKEGEKSVLGKSYDRFRMAREGGGSSTSAELWISHEEGTSAVTLAGGEYTSDTAKALGLPASGVVTLDAPVTVDLGAPLDQPQPFDIKGKIEIAGTSTSGSAKGSYTVVERGVTVETPAGAVSGCSRIKIKGTVPIFFGAADVSTGGEVWYSPVQGVVKATFDEPLKGFSAGINGSRGWHDLGNGYFSVDGVEVIGNGKNRFELSTTEVSGVFDADKNTHAKILIEMRWVDEANAKGSQRPMVTEQLGTALGYFPTQLVSSSVSFLHPEENGRGYAYWVAYADQAAKNEPGSNGIVYHAQATCDASLSPVRVSARIVYKRIDLTQHQD